MHVASDAAALAFGGEFGDLLLSGAQAFEGRDVSTKLNIMIEIERMIAEFTTFENASAPIASPTTNDRALRAGTKSR